MFSLQFRGELFVASKFKENMSWPFIVGFGLNFTWTSSVFFHSMLFSAAGHSFTYSNFYIASMAILIVTLALLGVCSRLVLKSFPKPAVLVCVGAVLFTGTMAAANASYDNLRGIVCFWAGILFTGLGSAYMLALWGWFLGAKVHQSASNMCAAYAFSAPIYFLMALLPAGITVALVSLLPALSLWVFWQFGKTTPDLPEVAAAKTKSAPKDATSIKDEQGTDTSHDPARLDFIPRLSLAAVLMGIVLSLMNYTSVGSNPSNSQYAFWFLIATELPLISFFLYFQAYKGKSSFQDRFLMVYRIAVLVIMGSVLLSIAIEERTLAFQVIALAGYLCLKMVFWSLFAILARNTQMSPVMVFCFGEGSLTAGLFIGNQLSNFLGVVYGGAFAALTLAILLVTYMFVLSERRLLAMIEEPEDENEPTHQRFRDRCDAIAAEYKLSRRETEVFYLFARGRSSSRIADDLYVSSGTVSTHLRNIYRKLDVHSRQELLDLVEGAGE